MTGENRGQIEKVAEEAAALATFPTTISYGLFWNRRRASAMKMHARITMVLPNKKLQQFLISVYCLECDRAARCE